MKFFERCLLAFAVAAAMTVGFAGSAAAQEDDYPVTTPTSEVDSDADVDSDAVAKPAAEASGPEVLGATTGGSKAASLALTGGDLVGLTAIGLGVIGAGFILTRSRRRDVVDD